MTEKYSSNTDLVHRYVQGKLTPEEQQEFEVYFLDKPEILEEIELASIFQQQLPKVKQSDTQDRKRFTLWQMLGACSCAVLLSLFGLLWLNNAPFTATQIKGKNIEVHYISPLRSGAGEVHQIVIKPTTQSVLLVLQPSNLVSDEFRVKFKDKHQQTIFVIDELVPTITIPGMPGDLSIEVEANWLLESDYVVEVSPTNDPAEKEAILLRVTRQ